jgi:hypothetical protein
MDMLALLAVAFLFTILFYHHAWSFLLAGDHLVEGLPQSDGFTKNQ